MPQKQNERDMAYLVIAIRSIYNDKHIPATWKNDKKTSERNHAAQINY